MSVSSCPACGKQVTMPSGVHTSAKVRCPLCHSQYTLADALVNMPPLLELVDETLAEQDDAIVEDRDTEVEEIGFTASEPLVRHAAADFEPLEIAGAEDEVAFEENAGSDADVLSFDEPAAAEVADSPPAELGETVDNEITVQFDEPAPLEDIGVEAPFKLDDDSAGPAAGSAETVDFDLSAEAGETAPGDEIVPDFEGLSESQPAADEGEMALDFGEPIEPESTPVALASDAGADAVKPAAESKADKKKKKKLKLDLPDEPHRRRPLSTVLSAVLGAVVAIPLTLYGLLWLGPDYDFLGMGRRLYGWGVPVPSAFARPTYVAAKPPVNGGGGLEALIAQRAAQKADDQATPAPRPAAETPAAETPQAAPAEAPAGEPAATTPPATPPAATEARPSLPSNEPAPTEAPPAAPAVDKPPSEPKAEEMPEKPAAPPPADAPAELPAPADAPKAEEKPTEPAAAGPAGPLNAGKIAPADLAKAIEEAQAADAKMAAAQGTAAQAELTKIRSNYFVSLFRLGDAVTLVDAASDSAAVDALREQVAQFVLRLAADEKRVGALKVYGGKWLTFPRRTTPGVILAGTVQGAQRVGNAFEVKLAIGVESDAPIVTVLAAADPGLAAGDTALALGTIVDKPAENLAGYTGSEASIVWSGMIVKAPAAR
jgi:hypothetical protein